MSSAVDNLSNTNSYSNTTITDNGRTYSYTNTSQGKIMSLNSPEGRNMIIIGSLITGGVVLILVLPMLVKIGGAITLIKMIRK